MPAFPHKSVDLSRPRNVEVAARRFLHHLRGDVTDLSARWRAKEKVRKETSNRVERRVGEDLWLNSAQPVMNTCTIWFSSLLLTMSAGLHGSMARFSEHRATYSVQFSQQRHFSRLSVNPLVVQSQILGR